MDGELFERLREWRGDQARRQQVPAYVVLHNSHLEEISTHKPRTTRELGSIKGIGLRRAARYGEDILALVNGGTPQSTPQESPQTGETDPDGYREHLRAAERLLLSGRGADAVPELYRALQTGGEEARRAVNALLTGAGTGGSLPEARLEPYRDTEEGA